MGASLASSTHSSPADGAGSNSLKKMRGTGRGEVGVVIGGDRMGVLEAVLLVGSGVVVVLQGR